MATIDIQIHDYDNAGRYRIVEDRQATQKELNELKNKARLSVKPLWDYLPKESEHIVYYAEMLNNVGNVWFAAIYMHGEAYTDDDFYETFCTPQIGYVGAIHKHK